MRAKGTVRVPRKLTAKRNKGEPELPTFAAARWGLKANPLNTHAWCRRRGKGQWVTRCAWCYQRRGSGSGWCPGKPAPIVIRWPEAWN